MEPTTQKKGLSINNLVLVRDVTSGAFVPRYSPNYRVVAIHGPNRIVVRYEKGNESVRRASHFKQCNLKDKVGTMVPKLDEYNSFGRSTKLLLHPRDVPDLQFSQKGEDNSEILPEVEVSTVECTLDVQKTVSGSNLTRVCGEIPP